MWWKFSTYFIAGVESWIVDAGVDHAGVLHGAGVHYTGVLQHAVLPQHARVLQQARLLQHVVFVHCTKMAEKNISDVLTRISHIFAQQILLGSVGAVLWIRITLMWIWMRIRIFIWCGCRCGSRSDFSPWCGTGSGSKSAQIDSYSIHFGFSSVKLMQIRIQLITLMRIRIQIRTMRPVGVILFLGPCLRHCTYRTYHMSNMFTLHRKICWTGSEVLFN